MSELFYDTFKCGLNGKVKVKYEKNSAKKANCPIIVFVLPKFTKMGRIIIHQSKLQCIGFNYFK